MWKRDCYQWAWRHQFVQRKRRRNGYFLGKNSSKEHKYDQKICRYDKSFLSFFFHKFVNGLIGLSHPLEQFAKCCLKFIIPNCFYPLIHFATFTELYLSNASNYKSKLGLFKCCDVSTIKKNLCPFHLFAEESCSSKLAVGVICLH